MLESELDQLESYVDQCRSNLASLKKERLHFKELLRLNTVDQSLEKKNLQTFSKRLKELLR